MTNAVLVLEDGQVFTGRSYGAAGTAFGEAVFSTGMTGYQEFKLRLTLETRAGMKKIMNLNKFGFQVM